ncbi:hypothetical protein TWF694_003075 [Orbilia ellipsospora]|uniref:Helicase C-terminal domain-containing protein n=1 Tax=Orbilia ellipsospora TaxID=2528407 RepID=A0AAV9X323_9PEZI
MGIQTLRVDGSVDSVQRSTIISKFQADSSIAALLMTIDSCAVGLTLTNANTVHIVEPQSNPAVEGQAIARAYRLGQTQTVTVIRYITENTVEEI